MLLETRHLKLVQEIAEQGGVTRASKRLFLTQSAVSHQLLDLEKRLGTPLFYRAGKKMVPTLAGQRVLTLARPALKELEKLREDLQRIAQGQDAVIRLSTECYTCYHWLPPLLADYHKQHPKVDVQIVAEVTHDPLPALLEGKIDLAIVHGTVDDERLHFTKLFKDELLLIVAADHPLAKRKHVTADDLADEHMIFYGVALENLMFYTEILEPAGVLPRRVSHIQLTEAIIELVRANVGVTTLARWAAAPYLADGRLAGVRVTPRGVGRQWYGAVLKQDPIPSHLREFMKKICFGPDCLQIAS